MQISSVSYEMCRNIVIVCVSNITLTNKICDLRPSFLINGKVSYCIQHPHNLRHTQLYLIICKGFRLRLTLKINFPLPR